MALRSWTGSCESKRLLARTSGWATFDMNEVGTARNKIPRLRVALLANDLQFRDYFEIFGTPGGHLRFDQRINVDDAASHVEQRHELRAFLSDIPCEPSRHLA